MLIPGHRHNGFYRIAYIEAARRSLVERPGRFCVKEYLFVILSKNLVKQIEGLWSRKSCGFFRQLMIQL